MANTGNILLNLQRQDEAMVQASKSEICRILWSKVSFLNTGCWVRLPLDKSPNPRVWLGSRKVGAHRLALFCRDRDIPAGKYCLHKCGYGLCVRPSHLYWGSPAENSRDRINHARANNNQAVLLTSLAGKYSDEDVRQIWFLFFHDGWRVSSIAKEIRCSAAYVINLLCRKRRTAVTEDLVGDYQAENSKRKGNLSNRSSSRTPVHHQSTFLRDESVIEVRRLLNEGRHPADVSYYLGLPFQTVNNLRKNLTYKHVPGMVQPHKFEPRYLKKRGRPFGKNRTIQVPLIPSSKEAMPIIGQVPHHDDTRSCDIQHFDKMLVTIWLEFHQKGTSISTISRLIEKPKRFVTKVVKGLVRPIAVRHLGHRGDVGMFGLKEIDAADAVEILLKYQKGRSQPELAKEYRTHRNIIANIIHRKLFATETSSVPELPDGAKRRFCETRLSAEDVRQIRRRFAAGESAIALGKKYGVVSRCIYDIKNRKTYQWVT